LTSGFVNVNLQAMAPSFFMFDAAGHVAATHADNTPIGTTTSTPPGTPAAPGELIVLYGNGFGVTNPPAVNGQLLAAPALLVQMPVIQFNGATGTIAWAGLSATGLDQFNLTVPSAVEDGDISVTAITAGINSPINGLITVKK
jgi:uncharacterized protein (TIGR03437 family)